MNLLERNIDALSGKRNGKNKSQATKLYNLIMIRNQNTCSCMRRQYEAIKKDLKSKLVVTVSYSKIHCPNSK